MTDTTINKLKTASIYIASLKDAAIKIIKMGATGEQVFEILSKKTDKATARMILMSLGNDLGLDSASYIKKFI